MNQPMGGGQRGHGHHRLRGQDRDRRGFSAAERMARLVTAVSNRPHPCAEDDLNRDDSIGPEPMAEVRTPPPEPPLVPTALMATDPETDPSILWAIAREEPRLRRWLVANPAASPALLETVSQLGGPGVRRALEVLLDEGNRNQSSSSSSTAKA
ncbi:hypothetical protein [Bifidobacterium choladohabitans]|nr:hypothetical protein [Bifidobacterium choladohabitans]